MAGSDELHADKLEQEVIGLRGRLIAAEERLKILEAHNNLFQMTIGNVLDRLAALEGEAPPDDHAAGCAGGCAGCPDTPGCPPLEYDPTE